MFMVAMENPKLERSIIPFFPVEGRHVLVSQGFPADEAPAETGPPAPDRSEHELLTTLFDLGRQVTAVLDLDDLLQQIPRLIGRLISFEAFAVYLLDERRGELRSAYSVGYPDTISPVRLKPGAG